MKAPSLVGELKFLKNNLRKRNIKLEEIAEVLLNEMNIRRGDIVMVHTSLQYIDLIDSQPEDLIFLLKMILGADGTLSQKTL